VDLREESLTQRRRVHREEKEGTLNSVPLFFFGPESGGVEDSEDSDLLALDAVREKVGRAGNDKLAGSGMTAGAAEARICADEDLC